LAIVLREMSDKGLRRIGNAIISELGPAQPSATRLQGQCEQLSCRISGTGGLSFGPKRSRRPTERDAANRGGN
jgi:hypothetical protein